MGDRTSAVRLALMRRGDETLRRASAEMSRRIARRFGDSLEVWGGCGYPRSGTTWLCQLMGSYLDVPHPRLYRLPVAMPCVLQGHWLPDRRVPRSIYIVRDGRDVMVSLYFYEVHLAKDTTNPRGARRQREWFRRVLGSRAALDDVTGNLPRYLEVQLQKPTWMAVPWQVHVAAWLDCQSESVALVRYETLVADAASALGPALRQVTRSPVDIGFLRSAGERYSVGQQTVLARDIKRAHMNLRKGVPGEWAKYFSREASAVFEQAAGDVLRRVSSMT